MITTRIATENDAAEISELVRGLAERFITPDYSATGAAVLLESMSEEQTCERMKLGFRYRVAIDDGRSVGVIAMIPRGHLYHLFVAESHQKRGIARMLWTTARDEALAAGNVGRITVNSSRYAVPVYRRLGFVEDGGITALNEVSCQPMVWTGMPTTTMPEDAKI